MRMLAMKIRTFVVFTFLFCGLISAVSATVPYLFQKRYRPFK
ncbi:hypothetical protein MIZ01_1001 [Sideroxyarcus emersonii]|uniref:Uncharacterized protein n=1 Tax=Sideroxyarcus emersonii TaxID=2764705 RepID=A0AAN1X9K5_9PROT|nr:hypothetical protein MIZ01_1001 [Sideroxyarcus emersonii]